MRPEHTVMKYCAPILTKNILSIFCKRNNINVTYLNVFTRREERKD